VTATPELSPVLTTAAAPARRRRGGNVSSTIAVVMLAVTVVLIVVVPFLPSYDPYAQDLSNAMLRPFSGAAGHLLGTDSLGRDVLSRLSLAGRVSVLIALGAVAVNVVLGLTLGLIAGYFGRGVNTVIMGVGDVQLAIPVMLLLIVIVSVVGPSSLTLVVVLGICYWVGYGRLARAIASSLREREFVLAPITAGASGFWVMTRHLLPNVLPQALILASFDVGVMITIEASLDYLGLGVQPPTPSWGAMIFDGQTYLQTNPWLCVVPGVAIFLLVGGIQFLSQRFTPEGGSSNG
jgi:peptide/nickel transport system permease protein